MKPNISQELSDIANDPCLWEKDESGRFTSLYQMYELFRHSVRDGKIGKTAQYWLIYMDIMRIQHQIHLAVQTNDFGMRLDAWERMLPFYFTFDKTNYARYGTWYVETLKNLEIRYPGLKQLLQSEGLSVQAQSSYSLRTSIDQRGEQTINRDAKTAGK